MTDDQQRARELLAQEYRKEDQHQFADMLEAGDVRAVNVERSALAAITAALRAAPEGFVMVKSSALDGIRTAAEACWVQSQDKSFSEWVRDRANGEARGLNAALTMLAARPQGVKDAT